MIHFKPYPKTKPSSVGGFAHNGVTPYLQESKNSSMIRINTLAKPMPTSVDMLKLAGLFITPSAVRMSTQSGTCRTRGLFVSGGSL